MAGESPADRLTAYIARLLGHAVSADEALVLRSVHRAALASWSRRENIPVRLDAMAAGTPITIQTLLGQDGAALAVPTTRPPGAPPPAAPRQAVGVIGIGIDIEEVDQLPDADDYREHPFYQDHFTPAEISYGIRQADTRATLCGIWAAKEAIVKSGLMSPLPGSLRAIEIGHDTAGRPMFSGCQLSISHTPKTAVAVCIAGATAATPAPAPQAAVNAPPPPPPPAARGVAKSRVAAALAGAIVIAGGVSLAAYVWL